MLKIEVYRAPGAYWGGRLVREAAVGTDTCREIVFAIDPLPTRAEASKAITGIVAEIKGQEGVDVFVLPEVPTL